MKYNTAPKDDPSLDWHPARIVYELRLKGWTLRKLSASKGWHPCSLNMALRRSWPKGERDIADALGLEPWDIWPSRYPEADRAAGACR